MKNFLIWSFLICLFSNTTFADSASRECSLLFDDSLAGRVTPERVGQLLFHEDWTFRGRSNSLSRNNQGAPKPFLENRFLSDGREVVIEIENSDDSNIRDISIVDTFTGEVRKKLFSLPSEWKGNYFGPFLNLRENEFTLINAREVQFRDLDTGDLKRSISITRKADEEYVTSARVSDSGKYIFYMGSHGTRQVMDAKTGELIFDAPVAPRPPEHVSMHRKNIVGENIVESPDGRYVFFAALDAWNQEPSSFLYDLQVRDWIPERIEKTGFYHPTYTKKTFSGVLNMLFVKDGILILRRLEKPIPHPGSSPFVTAYHFFSFPSETPPEATSRSKIWPFNFMAKASDPKVQMGPVEVKQPFSYWFFPYNSMFSGRDEKILYALPESSYVYGDYESFQVAHGKEGDISPENTFYYHQQLRNLVLTGSGEVVYFGNEWKNIGNLNLAPPDKTTLYIFDPTTRRARAFQLPRPMERARFLGFAPDKTFALIREGYEVFRVEIPLEN